MMPSAVFASEDGQLVVGRDAERRARLDPSRFEPNPKRRVGEGTLLLGDRAVTVTDALSAVLPPGAEETSRPLGGAKPHEVPLTHPAQWGPGRRNVLLAGDPAPGPGPLAASAPAGVHRRPAGPAGAAGGRQGRQGGAVPAPADRGAAARAVRGRAGHPDRAGGVDPAEHAAQRRAAGRDDPD